MARRAEPFESGSTDLESLNSERPMITREVVDADDRELGRDMHLNALREATEAFCELPSRYTADESGQSVG